MEPFKLEKAINGQAFYLENGYRGVIKYCVDDFCSPSGQPLDYPYIGYILDKYGFIYKANTCWDEKGKNLNTHDQDATTMVEDMDLNQEKPIKPFNLEEALEGNPVRLRNGQKAIIFYNVPEKYKFPDNEKVEYPLIGFIFNEDGTLRTLHESWESTGKYNIDYKTHKFDIIGMWEDDISTIIQKAFKEHLPVRTRKGEKLTIIHIIDSDNFTSIRYPVISHTENDEIRRNTLDGKLVVGDIHNYDIVGLWEEPTE